MAGALIADAQDLAQYVNRDFCIDEINFANTIIGHLQDELEMRLNRTLSVQAVTDDLILQRDARKLFLNATPVVSVTSVGVTTINGGSPTILPTTGYLWTPYGEIDIIAALELDFDWWGTWEARILVNYTAGVDGVNYPGIKGILLRAAGREYMNRARDTQGLASFSVEGSSWTFARGAAPATFNQDEITALSRLRKRVVAI